MADVEGGYRYGRFPIDGDDCHQGAYRPWRQLRVVLGGASSLVLLFTAVARLGSATHEGQPMSIFGGAALRLMPALYLLGEEEGEGLEDRLKFQKTLPASEQGHTQASFDEAALRRVAGLVFKVHVTKDKDGPFSRLGMEIRQKANGTYFKINEIKEGLVSRWNAQTPEQAVRPGDRIMEVNGIRANCKGMLDSIREQSQLNLEIFRGAAEAVERGSLDNPLSPIAAVPTTTQFALGRVTGAGLGEALEKVHASQTQHPPSPRAHGHFQATHAPHQTSAVRQPGPSGATTAAGSTADTVASSRTARPAGPQPAPAPAQRATTAAAPSVEVPRRTEGDLPLPTEVEKLQTMVARLQGENHALKERLEVDVLRRTVARLQSEQEALQDRIKQHSAELFAATQQLQRVSSSMP